MKTNTKNIHIFFLGCIIIFFMACMIIRPSIYMDATYRGFSIWATAVLPALFPFFFFTTLLSRLNIFEKLSFVFRRPLKYIYNAPSSASIVYLMSIVSGYPVGAKLIHELYKNQKINKYEAVRIHAFCSSSGPIFIIGTIGSAMLHNAHIGIILLCIHYLSALLNGILYRNYKKGQTAPAVKINDSNIRLDNILYESIKDSVLSVLIVGGYIAISFLVCVFLVDTHIIDIMTQPLSFLLSCIGVPKEFAQSIILGVTEITRGCLELSTLCSLDIDNVIILCSGILAFGGLSVALQSMTFLKKCGITLKMYLLQKFTQSTLAIIIAKIVTMII